MGNLGEVKRINKSFLVFGPPGSGKSYLFGEAAEDKRTAPVLVLNFEGGCSVLEGSNATVVQIRNIQDLNEQYERLAASLKEEYDVPFEILNLGTGQVEEVRYSTFRTVVIDSISEFYTHIMLDRGFERVAEMKAKANTDPRRNNPFIPEQADYMECLNRIRYMVRMFRDTLNRHFFMTALSKTDILPGEGAVKLPKLDGQAAEEVAGAVESCIYISSQKLDKKGVEDTGKRIMALNNFAGLRVKTRTAWKVKIADFIEYDETENPISKLFDLLGVKE